MTGECVDCGGRVENKNAAGHYRERCCACIIEVAGSDPASSRPIPGCSCSECERARAAATRQVGIYDY